MEAIALELDQVRDELVGLLQDYPYAGERDRELIYERCETLGGEIQELVGLLKLAIRSTDRAAAAEADRDPEYAREVSRLSQESLAAIHLAGMEVSAAISALREARPERDEIDLC